MIPRGDSRLMIPKAMENLDEVCKGLLDFGRLWKSMANDDASKEFGRTNKPLHFYWRAMNAAFDLSIPAPCRLQNGFWPTFKCELAFKDQFLDDGTLKEKYAKDPPFIGQRHH